MKYVAKHYVRVAKVLITPGEVFEANLTQAQEERLIGKDAIEKVKDEERTDALKCAPFHDGSKPDGEDHPETDSEPESELYGELPRMETPGSESELKEEPEIEPEPMEIDISEGFVPAKKSRKKKG